MNKLKIYNFTKETRVCAHQLVNVRSSLTVLTMNVKIFFFLNNLILKNVKILFKPKKCAKTFRLLSQSLWAIVSVEERLRLIYRRYFWLTKNVFKILKLTEKFYEKLFKSKYAPVMYRKVKKQLSDRCVYYFDVEEREEELYCKLVIFSHMLFEFNRNYWERPKLKRQFSQALQCLMLNHSGNVIIRFLDLRRTPSQVNY